MQGKRSLPEPVALLEHDVGNGDEDHHHAACDEEGPVDITEPQVLVGQQVAAGSVGGDDAVLVAVQELPLVADGVVQVPVVRRAFRISPVTMGTSDWANTT